MEDLSCLTELFHAGRAGRFPLDTFRGMARGVAPDPEAAADGESLDTDGLEGPAVLESILDVLRVTVGGEIGAWDVRRIAGAGTLDFEPAVDAETDAVLVEGAPLAVGFFNFESALPTCSPPPTTEVYTDLTSLAEDLRKPNLLVRPFGFASVQCDWQSCSVMSFDDKLTRCISKNASPRKTLTPHTAPRLPPCSRSVHALFGVSGDIHVRRIIQLGSDT